MPAADLRPGDAQPRLRGCQSGSVRYRGPAVVLLYWLVLVHFLAAPFWAPQRLTVQVNQPQHLPSVQRIARRGPNRTLRIEDGRVLRTARPSSSDRRRPSCRAPPAPSQRPGRTSAVAIIACVNVHAAAAPPAPRPRLRPAARSPSDCSSRPSSTPRERAPSVLRSPSATVGLLRSETAVTAFRPPR